MSDTQAVSSQPGERPAATVGRLGRIIRMGWTTADQVLASAVNAALSFLVAREVSASEFGSFSFAFIAFMYAFGIVRSLVSEPLIVRFSGASPAEQKRAIANSAGAAVLVGGGTGTIAALVGLVLGGLTGSLLVVLGFLLPGLLLQGHWRLAFFATGRPQAAFTIDLVWGGLQIAGVLALIQSGRGSTTSYLAAWGLSALAASVVGAVQAGVAPRLRGGPSWIRDHRDIGLRFTWGFLINQGAFNSAYVVVAAIAGNAAVGSIRGAEVLFGPLRIFFAAIWTFALPLASTNVYHRRPIQQVVVGVSVAASALSLAWTAMLLFVPTWLGEALLGETWAGSREIAGVFGLQYVAMGVGLGASLGLTAYAEAGLALRVILVQAPLAVGLGAAGAAWNGAYGVVLGLFVAQSCGAAYGWWVFLRRQRQQDESARRDGAAPESGTEQPSHRHERAFD